MGKIVIHVTFCKVGCNFHTWLSLLTASDLKYNMCFGLQHHLQKISRKKLTRKAFKRQHIQSFFVGHVWAKIFQKVCEICQEASKPILLHERACQVWQCWTQCDRMWQMHSLLSLFSRYYLPGPHTYDGPKFENEWCYLTSLWSLRCPHPAISLCQRYPRHICHGYHGLYPWRKKCRVEKFQISVKN